jgi:hypothetical protein
LRENLPPEYPYDVAGAERTIKAEDFDERVDVIPVSDPNIFSMAQRVTLAQTQLQLAQSNPQMHNLHAAYRRMYQALEVQNIEEILPPPPQPQPLDPAVENARALMGEILNTFPDQDHDVHIRIHMMFMKTPLVMTSPQVMGTFYAHIMEHVSQKARQMVMQEIQGLISQLQMLAQTGGVDPMAAQAQIMEIQMQMQNPAEIEKLVSHAADAAHAAGHRGAGAHGPRSDVRPARTDPHAGTGHQAAGPAAQADRGPSSDRHGSSQDAAARCNRRCSDREPRGHRRGAQCR